MPFPQINYCLICDDVRPEAQRKLTILGFYGIAPNVNILFKDFGLPLDRLSFVLLAESGGEGQFNVAQQILDHTGGVIGKSKEIEVKISEPEKRNNMAFIFGGLKFSRAGKYTFQLLVNEQVHFETNFEVSQGRPEDFV